MFLIHTFEGAYAQKVSLCMLCAFWASHAYAERTLMNCTLTLSARVQFLCQCSAYAFKLFVDASLCSGIGSKHQAVCICLLSIRSQLVRACLSYVWKLYSVHIQNDKMLTTCMRMPSVRKRGLFWQTFTNVGKNLRSHKIFDDKLVMKPLFHLLLYLTKNAPTQILAW